MTVKSSEPLLHSADLSCTLFPISQY